MYISSNDLLVNAKTCTFYGASDTFFTDWVGDSDSMSQGMGDNCYLMKL